MVMFLMQHLDLPKVFLVLRLRFVIIKILSYKNWRSRFSERVNLWLVNEVFFRKFESATETGKKRPMLCNCFRNLSGEK